MVAYQGWTHMALMVGQLQKAEEYYVRLFGMDVAFREAETADGWLTLRGWTGWDAARAAGVEPGLCSLRRDGMVLALEAAAEDRDGSRLSHLGLAVDEPDLDELRTRAREMGCQTVTSRDGLLVLADAYGIRWEITTNAELTSTGDRGGLWLDLPA